MADETGYPDPQLASKLGDVHDAARQLPSIVLGNSDAGMRETNVLERLKELAHLAWQALHPLSLGISQGRDE